MGKVYVNEYSDLIGNNYKGKKFVVWTHPDIPMYGAELVLDEEGNFVRVGDTVSKEHVDEVLSEKTNRQLLEEFDPKDQMPKWSGGHIKVTKNGEISWDSQTREFVIWDETYAYEVGRTHYPLCALAMLETYAKEYLG